MPDLSLWVWVVLAVAVLAIVALVASGLGRRPRVDDRALPRASALPADVWHVVEEYVPAGPDQPGRWVEMRRTNDREAAEQEWLRLRREDPDRQDGVRIVTTTAGAAAQRGPAPVPAPRQVPASERLSFVGAPDTAPLYDRLVRFARTDGVFALVTERLYLRILGQRPDSSLGPDDRVEYARRHGDAALVPIFADILRQDGGRERLENHMTHFLMGALGGPKRYSGRGMATAHAALHITDADFDRVINHVVAVLRDLDVPPDWIGEIGETVAPLREAIVAAPSRT